MSCRCTLDPCPGWSAIVAWSCFMTRPQPCASRLHLAHILPVASMCTSVTISVLACNGSVPSTVVALLNLIVLSTAQKLCCAGASMPNGAGSLFRSELQHASKCPSISLLTAGCLASPTAIYYPDLECTGRSQHVQQKASSLFKSCCLPFHSGRQHVCWTCRRLGGWPAQGCRGRAGHAAPDDQYAGEDHKELVAWVSLSQLPVGQASYQTPVQPGAAAHLKVRLGTTFCCV